MAEQKYREAVKLYTQALQCDPSSVVSLNNRAQAYLKLGDYSNATRDATAVIDKCQSNADLKSHYKKALFRRAFSQRELSNVPAALQDFGTLVSLDPGNKAFLGELERTQSLLSNDANASNDVNSKTMPPAAPGISLTTALAQTGDTGLGMTAKTTKKLEPKKENMQEGNEIVEISSSTVKSDALPAPPTSAIGASGQGQRKPTNASAKVVSPLKPPSVPKDPPKTVYELEKVWRALKGYPELFTFYLARFKKGTFKKVFKETVDSDLLSSVFSCVATHAEPSVIAITLEGLTKSDNFGMMLAMLPGGDLDLIRQAVGKLERADVAKAAELKASYKL